MARFYGAIGFITETETTIDVIVNRPTERMYKGDLLGNSRRLENGPGINDDLSISNRVSIIADPYINNHLFAIRYVKWRGTAWKVTSIDSEPPRLILTLGGVYNGETAS